MFNLDNVGFYCISMNNENGKTKWERVKTIFNQQNIDIKKIVGVNGKEMEVPTVCPNTQTKCKLNNGEYGCYLSHINVITTALENDLDYVFIFEDDVKLSDDFYDRIKYLEKCQIDFDMFYLSGSFNQFTINVRKTKHEYVYEYDGAAGTHAYILNKKIFKYILDNVRFDRAIDGFYATVIGNQPDKRLKDKKMFDIKGFMPHACGCYSQYSSISNQYTDNGMNKYFKNVINL